MLAVVCPSVGGDLPWSRWSVVLSVRVCSGVGGSSCRYPAADEPSGSVWTASDGRHSSPRMTMASPNDVTGAAAAGWLVWSLLERVGAEGRWLLLVMHQIMLVHNTQ